MRPGTKLEKRVESLARKVKGLTPKQKEWGFSHVIPHYCLYRTKTHQATCVHCGHNWTEKRPKRCPNCKAELTLKENSRQRRFTEKRFYGVIQRIKEFTVIRIFFVYDSRKFGEADNQSYMVEILQHWINDEGKDTVRARNASMFSYYWVCPFNLYSPISLKRDYNVYGYRNARYHISPDAFYPRKYVSETIKRNGFTGDFKGFNAEDVFCAILTDNRFETLWKLGLCVIAEKYLSGEKNRITKYWKAVLAYGNRGLDMEKISVWLDYLDLLEYFRKDIHNHRYLFPEDIDAEHNRLMRRKAEIEEREELERKKEREKEKLAVLESKSKYFDITFGNGNMFVVVLKSLEEYKLEGDYQHHCVYTNGYYGKKGTLILSARMIDSPHKPVETIEISLKDGKILQCYGKCNRHTEHHQEILDLVNSNSNRFLHVRKHKSSNNHGTIKQS